MLVGVETYRLLTGDNTTAASAVQSALQDAQDLVEESLDRVGFLESAEHTETVFVIRGKSWPTATPVTDAAYVIGDNGRSLLDVDSYPDNLVVDTYETFDNVARASITYTGGYTAETVPMRIKLAISQTAHRQLHPAAPVDSSYVGAKSIRVGDVSVTYGDGGAGTLVTALTSSVATSIRGYRRQEP